MLYKFQKFWEEWGISLDEFTTMVSFPLFITIIYLIFFLLK